VKPRLKLACSLVVLAACGADSSPPAPVPAAPPPSAPAAPPPAPAAPPADDPCTHPAAQKLDLELGVSLQTPWPLEIRYGIDDDRKLGPGYMFLLQSGARRWQTRRDSNNWQRSLMWQGYCWRGVGRAGVRAERVQVEVAPLCKDGKLVQMGASCGTVLEH
jgi:hypothetical protein